MWGPASMLRIQGCKKHLIGVTCGPKHTQNNSSCTVTGYLRTAEPSALLHNRQLLRLGAHCIEAYVYVYVFCSARFIHNRHEGNLLVSVGKTISPFDLPLVSREWKNGSNSSYNCTPFLHSLLTKGKLTQNTNHSVQQPLRLTYTALTMKTSSHRTPRSSKISSGTASLSAACFRIRTCVGLGFRVKGYYKGSIGGYYDIGALPTRNLTWWIIGLSSSGYRHLNWGL